MIVTIRRVHGDLRCWLLPYRHRLRQAGPVDTRPRFSYVFRQCYLTTDFGSGAGIPQDHLLAEGIVAACFVKRLRHRRFRFLSSKNSLAASKPITAEGSGSRGAGAVVGGLFVLQAHYAAFAQKALAEAPLIPALSRWAKGLREKLRDQAVDVICFFDLRGMTAFFQHDGADVR